MLPALSPATADALRAALDRVGYRTDGVRSLLGPAAHAALGRGEHQITRRLSGQLLAKLLSQESGDGNRSPGQVVR